jgi:hypothetical protein
MGRVAVIQPGRRLQRSPSSSSGGSTRRACSREVPAALDRLGAENYPMQAALVDSLEAAVDVEQMFEFGLARLLDGLAQYLVDQPRRPDLD